MVKVLKKDWGKETNEYIQAKHKIQKMTVLEKREAFGFNKMHEDEEWKPLTHKNGFIVEPYEMSQYGKCRNKSTDKILLASDSYGIKGKRTYPGYSVKINTKAWEDYTKTKRPPRKSDTNTTFVFSFTAHQGTMNTWKPFHEHLLPELEEYWPKFSPELKTVIRDAMLIDHIDDNPWNCHIDNLTYTTWSGNEWHNKITQNNTPEENNE